MSKVVIKTRRYTSPEPGRDSYGPLVTTGPGTKEPPGSDQTLCLFIGP